MATKRTTGKAARPKRKVSGKRGTPGRSKQNVHQQADPRGIIGLAVLCVGITPTQSEAEDIMQRAVRGTGKQLRWYVNGHFLGGYIT